MAIKSDGTLCGWGYPPIGDGTNSVRYFPVIVAPGSPWIAAECALAGISHTGGNILPKGGKHD